MRLHETPVGRRLQPVKRPVLGLYHAGSSEKQCTLSSAIYIHKEQYQVCLNAVHTQDFEQNIPTPPRLHGRRGSTVMRSYRVTTSLLEVKQCLHNIPSRSDYTEAQTMEAVNNDIHVADPRA